MSVRLQFSPLSPGVAAVFSRCPLSPSGLYWVVLFVSLSRLFALSASFILAASAVAVASCTLSTPVTRMSTSRSGSPVRARVIAIVVIQRRIPLGASVVIGQAASLAVRFDRGPLMVRIVTILS